MVWEIIAPGIFVFYITSLPNGNVKLSAAAAIGYVHYLDVELALGSCCA